MRLKDLKQGDRFRYAQYPEGTVYVKGSRIPGIWEERYYILSGSTVYYGGGRPEEEVIKVNK